MQLPQSKQSILGLSIKGTESYLKWCELVDALDRIELILPLAQDQKNLSGAIFFVDGGTKHLPSTQSPYFFSLGDGDSASLDKMQLLFPTAKDYTDLELALALIPAHLKKISIKGIWGGEKDHELANLGAINQFLIERKEVFSLFLDEKHYFLNRGTHQISVTGKFSLLLLNENKIKIAGQCEFPIKEFSLMKSLSGRGISNVGSGAVTLSLSAPAILYFPAGTHSSNLASSPFQSPSA